MMQQKQTFWKQLMYNVLLKNWDRNKYPIISGFVIVFLVLLTVVYKSNDKVPSKTMHQGTLSNASDFKTFKNFILDQIKSPFINIDYEIAKGDTIQKILKKYKVQNNEIQAVINQYRKYGSANKLLVGNKIEIIIEKSQSVDKN